MPAPALVGTTSGSNYTGTSSTLALPAGSQVGDVAIFVVGAFNGNGGYPSSGFTTGMDREFSTYDGNNTTCFIGTKTLTATDISNNYLGYRTSSNGGNNAYGCAMMSVYRNISSQVDVAGSKSGSGGGPPSPSLVTTRAGCLLFYASAYPGSGSRPTMPASFSVEAFQGSGNPPATILARRPALTGAPGQYGQEAHENGGAYTANQQLLIAVVVPSPPNPPTVTAPTNPTTNAVNRVAWNFTDPDTGDSQTAWELQYRVKGTTSATTVRSAVVGGGTNLYYDVPAQTFYGPVEVRVRNADTGPNFSEWSAWVAFTCPTVTGTSGTPEGASAQGQFHDPAITPAIAAAAGLVGNPTQLPAKAGSIMARLKAALAGALEQPNPTAVSTTESVTVGSGGAWNQVSASGAKRLVTSVYLNTSESAARIVRFDVGTGAAGLEVAQETVYLNAQNYAGWVRLPTPVLVNAGERLAVRLSPLDAARTLTLRSVPL